MTAQYSCTVLIETDGDPNVVLQAARDAVGAALTAGATYHGPSARLRFSRPLRERDVP